MYSDCSLAIPFAEMVDTELAYEDIMQIMSRREVQLFNSNVRLKIELDETALRLIAEPKKHGYESTQQFLQRLYEVLSQRENMAE